MAVANGSSSAMVKAVLLPLILVLLAMAAGASSTEDGPAVAKSGGRFSETPVGRKLLNFNWCGSGTAPDYNCKKLFSSYTNATCCDQGILGLVCTDIGSSLKCGSCTGPKCSLGYSCCSGVCVNLQTDKNNCGKCGTICKGTCKLGFCKY